nr:O-antigen ligase family protein [Desulfatibacillum alkenivorans]
MVGLGIMVSILAERKFFRKGIVMALVWASFIIMLLIMLMSTSGIERALTIGQGADMARLSSRVTVWKATCDMIADHPVFGVGPGGFALAFSQYQPPGFNARFFQAHNDYLHVVSELG